MQTLPATDALARSTLQHALHSIRAHFGMEVAFVSEVDRATRVLRLVDQAGAGALYEGRSDPLGNTYCERIIDGRLQGVIPDVARDAQAAALPFTRELSVGSHLGVPVKRSSGQVYGTFCCLSSRPNHALGERDGTLMALFASIISRILEHEIRREEAHRRRVQLVEDALHGSRMRMVFQPIVHLVRNEIIGYEALARFAGEPPRPPNEWFADAAAVGLQTQLELSAIRRALAALPLLPTGAYLSLNVSPSTVLAGGLRDVLETQPVHRLMLEITEHALIEDYAAIVQALAGSRGRGLKLAVDDAGAGFASFRHILKLKPDVIKLDRSLISLIDRQDDCRALAAALIRFADETACKVVAEGVETPEELAVLVALGVNKAQGYLLGQPGPLGAG